MARGRKNIQQKEVGDTGLNLKSYNGKADTDVSKLWKGERKKEFISEMVFNNPHVNAWINAKNAIALKPDWIIKPAFNDESKISNGDDKEVTQKDIETSLEYQKLIEGMLFEDMDKTFNNFILNASTMSEYGFSLAEIVLKKRDGKNSIFDDGLFGIAKLAPRWQNSITKWDIEDNGDINYVYQRGTLGATDHKIPYNKVLHFVMNGYNGNPEGESVLRGTFTSYYNKKNVERIQRETFERGFSGLLHIQAPARYMSKSNPSVEAQEYRRYLDAFMRNVKQGKEAGLITPYSKDFEIKLIQGETGIGLDPDKMIERFNTEIVMCLLSDTFMGQNKVYQGSSGSETKTKIYKSFIGIILDEIKSQINRKLIPLLFDINNLDKKYMPTLDYGNLDDLDLQALSWFIQSVAKTCGPMVTPTYELNNYLLKKIVGNNAPIPTRQEYENEQVRHEVQTINNVDYQALQDPEYLDSDDKNNSKRIDVSQPSIDDTNTSTSPATTSKPRGNFGGGTRGGESGSVK